MLGPLLDHAGAEGGRRPSASPSLPAAESGPRVRCLSEPDLERELLRKAVGALYAGRASCKECGRTPLVGERVHLFADGARVCELCRPARRAEPERSEVVHHSERGQTVRRRAA
jgi:hypothetical protein